MDVDPVSGQVVAGRVQVQMNIFPKRTPLFYPQAHDEHLLPLYYSKVEGGISDELAKQVGSTYAFLRTEIRDTAGRYLAGWICTLVVGCVFTGLAVRTRRKVELVGGQA